MKFIWWISVLAFCAIDVEGRGGKYCPAIPRNVDIHIETEVVKHKKPKNPSAEEHVKKGGRHKRKNIESKASLAFKNGNLNGNAWEAPGDPWDIYGPMSTFPSDRGSEDAQNKGPKMIVQVVAKPDSQASDKLPFSTNDWSQPQKMTLSPGTDGMQVASDTPWAMEESLKTFPWQKPGNVKSVEGKPKMASPATSFAGNGPNYGSIKRVQCLMCKLQNLVREGSPTPSHAEQEGKSENVSRIVSDGIKQLVTKETELRNKLSSPGINNSEKRILLEQLSEVRRLQVEVYKSKLLTNKGPWNAGNCDCSKCNGGSEKKHLQQSSGATLGSSTTKPSTTKPSITKPSKLSSPTTGKLDSAVITAPSTKPKKINRTPKVTPTSAASWQSTASKTMSKTMSKASHGTNQPSATEKPKVIIIRNTVFVCKDTGRSGRVAEPLTPTPTKGSVRKDPPTKPTLSVPSAVPLSPLSPSAPSAPNATKARSLGSLPTASAQPGSPITTAPKPFGSPASANGSGAVRGIKPKSPITPNIKQGFQTASQARPNTKESSKSQSQAAPGTQRGFKLGSQNARGGKPVRQHLELDGLSIDKLKGMRADYLERLKNPNLVAQKKADYWEIFQKINEAITRIEVQGIKLDEKGTKDLASKTIHVGKKIAEFGLNAERNPLKMTPDTATGAAGDVMKNTSKSAEKTFNDAHHKAPSTVDLKKKLQLDVIKAILGADV